MKRKFIDIIADITMLANTYNSETLMELAQEAQRCHADEVTFAIMATRTEVLDMVKKAIEKENY